MTEQDEPATNPPLVYSESTWRVRSTWTVEAQVEALVTVTAKEVAEWAEIDPSEVDEGTVRDYVMEADDVIDESMYDLLGIDSWERGDAKIMSTEKHTVTPPSFVPLFDLPEPEIG